MNAANQRQLTPWLVAFMLLLGALLVLLLAGVGRGARWDAPRAAPPLPAAAHAGGLPQPVPLQQFAQVWHKPLFSPDRKPTVRAGDGGSQMGDLQLTGIILTPTLRMALLHDRSGDREIRLREGESLPDGSVTLVEIHPRSAWFDAASGRTELKLPAGAPVDTQRGAADEASPADARADPDTGLTPQPLPLPTPAMPPDTRGTPGAARESPAERLRKNIQKRRAERAAAANEGVG